MKTNTKIWILTAALLVLVIVLFFGTKGAQIFTMIKAGKGMAPPPESASSARVEAAEWQPSQLAVGTLVAVHGVTLGVDLPGTVREVAFESGAFVKKGDLLVRMDTSTEEAQLAAARADAALARVALQRARALREGGASAQAELDTAVARAAAADATVDALQAAITKKTIRAPFAGRMAIRQVEVGQALGIGAPVASLQSVDPIFVDFWLPQQALADLKAGQQVRVHVDAFGEAAWDGAVSAVNTEVDAATRNVRVRATLPNRDGRLRPGMYANVELVSARKQPVLVIPATAVLFAPYGDSVFALEEKKDEAGTASVVARQKFVRLGERRGDLVAVVSGLEAGETIVSSGAFKLKNGTKVVVKNDLAPKAEMAPKPVDR